MGMEAKYVRYGTDWAGEEVTENASLVKDLDIFIAKIAKKVKFEEPVRKCYMCCFRYQGRRVSVNCSLTSKTRGKLDPSSPFAILGGPFEAMGDSQAPKIITLMGKF